MALQAADLTDEQMLELLAQASVRLKQTEHAKVKESSLDNFGKHLSLPKIAVANQISNSGRSTGDIVSSGQQKMDKEALDKQSVRGFRKVEDPIAKKASDAQKKIATAGSNWYDLPKTDLTPALKRDLQLLKMRNVLDPHRHYKKDNGKMKPPEYSHVGTITEGAAEFFSGRIENKKRKRTFVEEVLEGENQTGRFQQKFLAMQSKKSSGKKAFYQKIKAKRNKGVKKGG